MKGLTQMEPNINDIIDKGLLECIFLCGGTWKVLLLIITGFIGIFSLLISCLAPPILKDDKNVVDVEKDSQTFLHVAVISVFLFVIELLLPTSIYQAIINFSKTLPLWAVLLVVLCLITLPHFISSAISSIIAKIK